MSKAYKCDICNSFVENTIVTQILIGDKAADTCIVTETYDICPDCMASFKWWLGTRHPKFKVKTDIKYDGGCGWVD
jgi:hypothetical protein